MKEVKKLKGKMDKLVFLIRNLYFLSLEWMYLKFKIEVLSNLRLKFGISNDVCPYKILLQWNRQSLINMKQKNVSTRFLF